jgi:hypothetical protein
MSYDGFLMFFGCKASRRFAGRPPRIERTDTLIVWPAAVNVHKHHAGFMTRRLAPWQPAAKLTVAGSLSKLRYIGALRPSGVRVARLMPKTTIMAPGWPVSGGVLPEALGISTDTTAGVAGESHAENHDSRIYPD